MISPSLGKHPWSGLWGDPKAERVGKKSMTGRKPALNTSKVKPRRRVTSDLFQNSVRFQRRGQRGLHSPQPALFRVEDKEFWSKAEGDKSCSVSQSIMQQMEDALLYAFLEASSDCKFKEQLWSLTPSSDQGAVVPRRQGGIDGYQGRIVRKLGGGLVPRLQGPGFDDESELQCDGNRSGHLQNGELEADAPANEDVIGIIAAQLAEIGDKLDKDVQGNVVNDLVQHFLNENLSTEEIMRHMSRVVRELAQAIPADMEQEKVMLVLAMVLAKKIVNTVPSLLNRAFTITVNFMNQQFHNYIDEMLGE
ncbi:BH3-interacting domain death agonist isoform X1 [Corapipo altera]|uniref:BH3-interacting domain death agonist isoform X1 n=2 Tax=Corapipo altera TaxID=415028 RepID=UPI000FD6427D|nr:BH3-interacting domain death agonist isoform X1 [Corapipo altera]